MDLEIQNEKVAFEEVIRRRQTEFEVATDEVEKLEVLRKEKKEA